MENSNIEWCKNTFNAWIGCSKVSPGCTNCYALALDKRWGGDHWGTGKERKIMSESYWRQPLKWNKEAEKLGEHHRVFCSSLADVFDLEAPAGQRDRLFDLIKTTPYLDWLLLTKRPENILSMLPSDWVNGYRNVWLGTTVENQAMADKRIPELIKIPAIVRFLSCEPLLEFVDLFGHLSTGEINWVIAGGESGPGSRPMHPEWARIIRDQCSNTGVSFLFKQWGSFSPIDQPWRQDSPKPLKDNEQWLNAEGGMGFHGSEVWRMRKMDKKAAGRLLDGRTWDEYPVIVPEKTTLF